MSTCLVAMWDGPYRHRCSLGTKGVCAYHGPHQPHPDDGRPCDPMPDGYCPTHGMYVEPGGTPLDPRPETGNTPTPSPDLTTHRAPTRTTGEPPTHPR